MHILVRPKGTEGNFRYLNSIFLLYKARQDKTNSLDITSMSKKKAQQLFLTTVLVLHITH